MRSKPIDWREVSFELEATERYVNDLYDKVDPGCVATICGVPIEMLSQPVLAKYLQVLIVKYGGG